LANVNAPSHAKELSMEPQQRLELIDTLLAEAMHKREVFGRAIAAHGISQEDGHATVPGMPRSAAEYNIQAEQECWEQLVQGLTEVRGYLEQIAHAEGQRRRLARGARV
jgi:hypothetical protein